MVQNPNDNGLRTYETNSSMQEESLAIGRIVIAIAASGIAFAALTAIGILTRL